MCRLRVKGKEVGLKRGCIEPPNATLGCSKTRNARKQQNEMNQETTPKILILTKLYSTFTAVNIHSHRNTGSIGLSSGTRAAWIGLRT